jgi:uncharacterized membrane protein YtjA (UPF0391 family)
MREQQGEGSRLPGEVEKLAFSLEESDMLRWALIFAVIALIAGALGFGGIAGAAAGIAKILFFLFLIGFVIFLALGVFAGRKIAGD